MHELTQRKECKHYHLYSSQAVPSEPTLLWGKMCSFMCLSIFRNTYLPFLQKFLSGSPLYKIKMYLGVCILAFKYMYIGIYIPEFLFGVSLPNPGTIGRLFQRPDLQQALVAFRGALTTREPWALKRRRSFIEGRKVALESGLLKDLPAACHLVRDYSC